jgi:hypothetical protein
MDASLAELSQQARDIVLEVCEVDLREFLEQNGFRNKVAECVAALSLLPRLSQRCVRASQRGECGGVPAARFARREGCDPVRSSRTLLA